jgi:DnaK suppressor protein
MARREALLRLHKSLVARANTLRKALAGELEDLRNSKARDTIGDSADAAFDSGNEEIASQLAELEARELNQIEKALARIKQGIYGNCEHCQAKIPVARLNALPYSTTCVECQREMELNGEFGDRDGADWGRVADPSGAEEKEVDLSAIELDIPNPR